MVGGWVGIYYLFTYLKFELFLKYWLPNFVFNLIEHKNHLMISKKFH
jgi:hypothetical protein